MAGDAFEPDDRQRLDALISDVMAVLRGQPLFVATKPPASFVTLQILRRVLEGVVAVRTQGRYEFTKHVMHGTCVLHTCGVKLLPDRWDVDKIGNHQDIWFKRRYVDVDKKLAIKD